MPKTNFNILGHFDRIGGRVTLDGLKLFVILRKVFILLSVVFFNRCLLLLVIGETFTLEV